MSEVERLRKALLRDPGDGSCRICADVPTNELKLCESCFDELSAPMPSAAPTDAEIARAYCSLLPSEVGAVPIEKTMALARTFAAQREHAAEATRTTTVGSHHPMSTSVVEAIRADQRSADDGPVVVMRSPEAADCSCDPLSSAPCSCRTAGATGEREAILLWIKRLAGLRGSFARLEPHKTMDAIRRGDHLGEPLKLHECAICSSKPGSPDLCRGCMLNREAAGSAWRGPLLRRVQPATRAGDNPLLVALSRIKELCNFGEPEQATLVEIADICDHARDEDARRGPADDQKDDALAGWAVTRHREEAQPEFLKDHRGGSGNDVLEWTGAADDAFLMCLREAQAYALVSYEAAYPVWLGVPENPERRVRERAQPETSESGEGPARVSNAAIDQPSKPDTAAADRPEAPKRESVPYSPARNARTDGAAEANSAAPSSRAGGGSAVDVINETLGLDGVVTIKGDELKCWRSSGDGGGRDKTYLNASDCITLSRAFAALAAQFTRNAEEKKT